VDRQPPPRSTHSEHYTLEIFTGAAIEGILVDIALGRAASVGGSRRQ
jgi:hypothetical protein